MKLVQLWHYKTGGPIEGLAFSDKGNLGVASWDGCAYVFDQNGNLLSKVCGKYSMHDASYCCGRFGFVGVDDYAYITDQNGDLVKKIHVRDDYDMAITMTKDGFVACKYRCALFDLNGNKFWDLEVGRVYNGPSRYQGYWYVADWVWGELLIVKDGSVVKEMSYGESAWDTTVCDKLLAVSTDSHLYLYDLSNPENPREIWRIGGFEKAYQVAFGPDCKYVAVADTWNHKLKIFSIGGDLVLEKEYNQYGDDNDDVVSVAWWRDRVAVGLYGGDVHVYKINIS